MADGFVVEVFGSLQGEGKYLGARHVFVRLAGCSIGCAFCDTDHAPADTFTVHDITYGNPVDGDTLACLIQDTFDLSTFHAVSFTGGEPLEQFPFLIETARALRDAPAKLMLETSGCDVERLSRTDGVFDIYSIDIKPLDIPHPQDVPGMLNVAAELSKNADVILKYILSLDDTAARTQEVARQVRAAGFTDVFIQPLHDDAGLDMTNVNRAAATFSRNGVTAYARPQLHKLLNIP